MFDFVTRRRLIFSLLAFLFVIISIVFIAQLRSTVILSFYQFSSSSNISIDKDQQISTCYLTETVTIVAICQKCTSYDHRSNANGCSPSGYREFVLCSNSKIKTYRSCPMPEQIQKQHFWIFEGFILFLGLLSLASVFSRQKTMDKQMVEKIKRQIGESEE